MDKFKVGDVCVLMKCNSMPELNGTELTITGSRYYYICNRGFPTLGYPTDLVHKGLKIHPEEHQLKLKRPDGEESIFNLFTTRDTSLVESEKLETILREKIKENM